MTDPKPEVRYEIVDRIVYITIDRPDARNAINRTVRKGLIDAFSDASVNPDVWAVVITGTGDRAFCAGADLKENNANAQQGRRHVVPMTGPDRNVFEMVLETYKPTIAALNGLAVRRRTRLVARVRSAHRRRSREALLA